MPIDDPNEYFYWVDQNDNEIGKIKRSEAHNGSKKIHRCIYVVITNSKGELLLQKRSINKDLGAGKLGMSVGGHLEYGDTYEGAAKREIKEELGISPKLKFVRKDLIESPEEIEYSAIFSASVDEQPMEFDKDEIDEVRWVPIRELRRLIDKEEISDGAKSVMKIMGYIESDL